MDSSKLETLEAFYVNRCVVQTCKKLNEIIDERCCGCKMTWNNQDCLIWTQEEKVGLYFDEAFRCMNLSEVEKRVKDCVFGLLPKANEQIKFWQRLPVDPRKEQAWRGRIKTELMNTKVFSW